MKYIVLKAPFYDRETSQFDLAENSKEITKKWLNFSNKKKILSYQINYDGCCQIFFFFTTKGELLLSPEVFWNVIWQRYEKSNTIYLQINLNLHVYALIKGKRRI
jgi:hypothetical protein